MLLIEASALGLLLTSRRSHCQSGMILAINPTESETQEMAVTNAEGSESEGAPEGTVLGGKHRLQ